MRSKVFTLIALCVISANAAAENMISFTPEPRGLGDLFTSACSRGFNNFLTSVGIIARPPVLKGLLLPPLTWLKTKEGRLESHTMNAFGAVSLLAEGSKFIIRITPTLDTKKQQCIRSSNAHILLQELYDKEWIDVSLDYAGISDDHSPLLKVEITFDTSRSEDTLSEKFVSGLVRRTVESIVNPISLSQPITYLVE